MFGASCQGCGKLWHAKCLFASLRRNLEAGVPMAGADARSKAENYRGVVRLCASNAVRIKLRRMRRRQLALVS
jgi:hypothetical protein